MSFLSQSFNRALLKSDPVVPTFDRVSNLTDDGSEVITYEPRDILAIKKRNSPSEMWRISSLISAGIDPGRISGNSSPVNRLDSASAAGQLVSEMNKIADLEFSKSE